ncbi:MAG TPA: 4-alpha-glucanotransferase, partial [Actinomycetota bacterium]|nr:4-alpha-glucanotransferase [Actinomycetota bacterium]
MPTLRSTPGRGAAQLRAALRELASLHGIQASYTGADGRRRFGSSSSILAVLRALGSPVEGMADIPDALRARRDQLAHRLVEPVLVAWDGRLDRGSPLQPPPLVAGEAVRISIELEGQEEREVGATGLGLPGFGLPDPLPPGYHRARVRSAGREATALIISAPRRRARGPLAWWGVSMPLYALHSSRSWGIGDLADLGQLLEWVGRQGGDLVATLPLLASFLGERPFEPSPYSPASRLFWNEVFLDVESIPEAQASP